MPRALLERTTPLLLSYDFLFQIDLPQNCSPAVSGVNCPPEKHGSVKNTAPTTINYTAHTSSFASLPAAFVCAPICCHVAKRYISHIFSTSGLSEHWPGQNGPVECFVLVSFLILQCHAGEETVKTEFFFSTVLVENALIPRGRPYYLSNWSGKNKKQKVNVKTTSETDRKQELTTVIKTSLEMFLAFLVESVLGHRNMKWARLTGQILSYL